MGKYLKKFDTTSQYNAYTADTANFIKPNVSLITETNTVAYNPYVPETMVVAKYNVTSAPETKMILGSCRIGQSTGVTTAFTRVYVDGNEIEISNANINYTFDTVGEHTVKYELNNPTAINGGAFTNNIYEPLGVDANSITIPNSVTNIGSTAFMRCSGLTSITIPNSVTTIADQVFFKCSSLSSVTIGSGVTSIGGNAFYLTPWWNSYSADTSHHYGNIIYINDVAYYATSTSITSATFKSGTVSISQNAFMRCSGLTSVTIPDSVTSIGNSAFQYCTGLTSIDIPSSVTTINSNTFGNCGSLTSIDIPSGVTSIGSSAFQNCSGLTSIDIPSGVTSIGTYAFAYCSGLTSIVSNATTAPTIQSNTFQGVGTNGTLTVPSGSSGYDTWMQNANYYLGLYNWTKVEQ